MITVLLADDYPATRSGIRRLLEQAGDLQVVGEAEDHNQVRTLVAALRPDILLLDVRMPGPSASATEKWVRENYPQTTTLVLTGHDKDAYLAHLMEAGAAGYLSKAESAERLIGCIRRAAGGEVLYDPEQIERAKRWRRTVGDKMESLSERERQVLKMVAQGADNREIAEALGISPKTAEGHVTRLLKKLEVDSRVKAMLWVHLHFPDGLDDPMG